MGMVLSQVSKSDTVPVPMVPTWHNLLVYPYLWSTLAGEFLTGTLEQVQDSISAKDDANPDRTLPNLVLPEPAPEQCNDGHVANKHCGKCEKSQTWWEKFKSTVDELLFRLNRHKCYSGCTDPKYGTCKAC